MLNEIKGGLIVSCQALEDEPLHGSMIMAKMAKAAKWGNAVGIRANSVEDIQAIKNEVDLPVIGIIKREYPESEVYITPTKAEVNELLSTGVDMIAIDATNRKRPNGGRVDQLVRHIQANRCLVMADISTFDEGVEAAKLGVDCISTTLSGYTPYSRQQRGPDFHLLEQLVRELNMPIIAEGRIQTPEEAKKAIELGAHAVVVGSAITRPQLITHTFAEKLKQ
ncbi:MULTISPECIES: N-acetylmannosamine-6-phosphate 2-epimerase [Shouchella]|uniref:Putative N-acetylmannosamine-6-phosphate 2-epimerase n=1 Tax=Shouchella rhizosphaerae TaxID=866786 RepID=A0ABZ2D4E4_9BACI|nr:MULTISPECIES: N-acetylmannosamine-6-phosphate 2-epimerase [Shouchella]MBU8598028.1 N-acetylmannosamine-6-phosphate 2-epimerase [Shouchella clausii]MCY1105658.1 N-acetylmannosamine-6-phosphate 2-epimerase [Shouchella clausii]MCZ1184108.1 N-acetylmannosamine-6-phosphate 2-epimerase [Shouchella clausii]MDO7285832.1 N-acetylmannosamine-6-phosphate 2-epimerase [Shouchella clausii]MDO7305736.1 N-acetylmannosamine-6-phosphate 2-epimerase [Shouchella clausii]